MTPKQAKYAENRIAGLGRKEAAIAAGYSPQSADSAAARCENVPEVRSAIKKGALPAVIKPKKSPGRPSLRSKVEGVVKAAGRESQSYLKESYDSPLDLLLDVVSQPLAPDGLRIECAKIAAPFVHGKPAPKALGKKEQADARAKELARGGRFTPRRAPKALVN